MHRRWTKPAGPWSWSPMLSRIEATKPQWGGVLSKDWSSLQPGRRWSSQQWNLLRLLPRASRMQTSTGSPGTFRTFLLLTVLRRSAGSFLLMRFWHRSHTYGKAGVSSWVSWHERAGDCWRGVWCWQSNSLSSGCGRHWQNLLQRLLFGYLLRWLWQWCYFWMEPIYSQHYHED